MTTCRFKTYFPHIDNVYSHRSTQRHKRKRFVSHYWDCRLKGRPPGTKKSTDPDKKKRKRVARERDLCDVKIKITEYFDQQEYTEQVGQKPPGAEDEAIDPVVASLPGSSGTPLHQTQQFFGETPMNTWTMPTNITQAGMTMPQFTAGPGPPPPPRPPPKKYYTFQRVNGNGGNGKGDGVAGPHKHTLEVSDRVKKNSVARWLAKCEKDDRRKPQVSLWTFFLLSFLIKPGRLQRVCYFFYLTKRPQSMSRYIHAPSKLKKPTLTCLGV
jgi:glutathione S-transferase